VISLRREPQQRPLRSVWRSFGRRTQVVDEVERADDERAAMSMAEGDIMARQHCSSITGTADGGQIRW